MIRWLKYPAALGLLSVLLSGCGLPGDLYLPDEKPQEVVTPGEAGTPAPQSQKKDREKNTGAATQAPEAQQRAPSP